jgi:hypothetical protein
MNRRNDSWSQIQLSSIPKRQEMPLFSEGELGWLVLFCSNDNKNCNKKTKETDNDCQQIMKELDMSSSLQALSLLAFSRALPCYDDMNDNHELIVRLHGILATMPKETLTALSILCSHHGFTMTDDMAYVLAAHGHVERLVLNAKHLSLTGLVTKTLHQHPGGTSLQRLELPYASLSPDVLFTLAQYCPNLTHLSFSHATVDHPDEISTLCDELASSSTTACFPKLQVLDLSHCDWITDRFLFQLIKARQNTLQRLYVSSCASILRTTCLSLNLQYRCKPMVVCLRKSTNK